MIFFDCPISQWLPEGPGRCRSGDTNSGYIHTAQTPQTVSPANQRTEKRPKSWDRDQLSCAQASDSVLTAEVAVMIFHGRPMITQTQPFALGGLTVKLRVQTSSIGKHLQWAGVARL